MQVAKFVHMPPRLSKLERFLVVMVVVIEGVVVVVVVAEVVE